MKQEIVTFTSIDNNFGSSFTYTVKKEFVDKNPNYLDLLPIELFTKTSIIKYLHNEEGPALIQNNIPDTDSDKYGFFIEGKPFMDKDEIIKLFPEWVNTHPNYVFHK